MTTLYYSSSKREYSLTLEDKFIVLNNKSKTFSYQNIDKSIVLASEGTEDIFTFTQTGTFILSVRHNVMLETKCIMITVHSKENKKTCSVM